MKNTIVLICFVFSTHLLLAQQMTLSFHNKEYKAQDSLILSLKNNVNQNYFYSIGLEVFYKGEWLEFDPDILTDIVKLEGFRKIGKFTQVQNNVALPEYLDRIAKEDNNQCNIRLRLKYGPTSENHKIIYSDTIQIVRADINSCDTISKKEFLLLSETIYKKLTLINNFSDSEMRQAIKVYNSIFLLSSKSMKSKIYIRDFQKKFDSNYRLPLSNNSDEIVVNKYSGMLFTKLDVTLLNKFLIDSGLYTCKDLFQIK